MSKTKLLAFLCCFTSFVAFSQSSVKHEGQEINRIDKDGKKTGIWKLFDKARDITIVGKMKDDVFVSNIDYYQKGKLMVTQDKDNNDAYIFYIDSKPVSVKEVRGNDKVSMVKDNGEELDKGTRDSFFNIMMVEAMFYGETGALPNFLNNELNKKEWDHSGKVKIVWMIDKNGSVKDAKVMKTDDPVLNEDAIRIIESMPRWQPSFSKGKFYQTRLNTTISFNDM